jgi:hypothetical protein
MIHVTISDLVLLKDFRIEVTADLMNAAIEYENLHRDFGSCHDCCAISLTPHQPSCPRATILFENDWYERIKARD